MNNTIKFWLEYVGGMDIVWLILLTLAGTQLWKMLLGAFGALDKQRVRPMPYLIGAFGGLSLVEFSSHGALIGIVCGMLASLGYYSLAAYLDREGAPTWQKKIAQRMALR